MKRIARKIINIILSFGLLLQNFMFMMPVYADTDDIDFTIDKIEHSGNDVPLVDGIYTSNGYESTFLMSIIVNNVSEDDELNVRITNEEGDKYIGYYSKYSHYMNISKSLFKKAIEKFTIDLCDNYECDNVYATKEITINFVNYDLVKDSVVYFDKVRQGGNVIDGGEYGSFTLNDKQDVIVDIKGEHLIPDIYYEIDNGTYSEGTKYLGSDLMDGIEYVFHPAKNKYFYLSCGIKVIHDSIKYKSNDELNYPNFNFYTDDTLPEFSSKLRYTSNLMDISGIKIDYNHEKYIISKKYHDNNKTLSIYVKGDRYENKDYNVLVNVYSNNKSFYSKTFSVNGNDINNGTNIELDKLVLSGNTDYRISVGIDGISNDYNAVYTTNTLTINGVKENGSEVSLEDGVYVATGYRNVYLDIDTDYSGVTDSLYLKTYNKNVANSYYSTNYSNHKNMYIINEFNNEIEEFDIVLCDNYICDNIYAIESIKVKAQYFDAIKNQKIIVSDITQGGKTITPNDNAEFIINDKQDVKVRVKGENLIPDMKYTITNAMYDDKVIVLGSELEEGKDVVFHINTLKSYNVPKDYEYRMYFYMDDNGYLDDYYYFDGENYILNGENGPSFRFKLEENNDIPSYDASFVYTYNKDIEIKMYDDYYGAPYVLNSNYLNKTDGLSYHIDGNNYENKDYNVKITAYKESDNSLIYQNTFSVNGKSINDGVDIKLNNLRLSVPTVYEELDDQYSFYITIDDVTIKTNAIYNSLGTNPYVFANFVLNGTDANLMHAYYAMINNGAVYEASNVLFNKYNNIGVRYKGYDFVNDDTYDYVLEYGYNDGNIYDDKPNIKYVKTITSGQVKGEVLNKNGLLLTVNNNNNYEMPTYRLTIKKGNEIVAYSSPVLYLEEKPMFTNAKVVQNNKEALFGNSDRQYLINRNDPIEITLSGIGFENKDYEFEMCLDSYESECKKIFLKGNEINNGTAKYTISDKLPENQPYYHVSFDTIDPSTNYDNIYTYISFMFDDPSNLIIPKEKVDYIVDDENEVVKNVNKNTNVESFVNNIEVVNNEEVIILDKTGTNEVIGKIGTGMILRIVDEDDNIILEVPVVVKGDTTGDGNLSISDLVKTKKHLAGSEELIGVYEMAGDVSNTGEVDLTDLIKMARDVAQIEELQ